MATDRPYRLPLILLVIGFISASQAHLTAGAATMLVIGADLVLTAVLGAARGYSIQLSSRDGYLYQRGGLPTLALWLLSIAVRLGLELYAHRVGVGVAATSTLTLTFGVSLAVQALVLQTRIRTDGRPVRPADQRRQDRGIGRGRGRGDRDTAASRGLPPR